MSRRSLRLAHVFHEPRTERTFETGANGASRLRGEGNRERSEHGFKRPLGAPPYRFDQNAAICLAGC